MQAIKAIYDGTTFKPTQPIPVKEQYEVVITFIEPLKKLSVKENQEKNLHLYPRALKKSQLFCQKN